MHLLTEINFLQTSLITLNHYHVTVRGKEPVTCVGVNEDLELIIKDSNGNIKNVLSGEITFK